MNVSISLIFIIIESALISNSLSDGWTDEQRANTVVSYSCVLPTVIEGNLALGLLS